jgi:iron(III) transport system substrate-binding protein
LLAAPAACGDAEEVNALVIYSGRNEELVGGVLDQLEKAVGGGVEVCYGSSAEMAAQLLEEGDRTQADVFFSQDAGALGAVAGQGGLSELPADVLELVPAEFRADDGPRVATSARARFAANEPQRFENNIAILNAIIDSQLAAG